jgi:hypothetical protein
MAANTFLPISDFAGDDTHRPSSTVRLGQGLAIYNGEIVFTNVARSDAEKLLPRHADLALAANHGAFPDTHPIIHLHGKQTQTSWVINGAPVQVGQDYGEFMLLIPFVQIGGSTQWHNLVVRMYLEDPGAVSLGYYFGYRKRLAQVSLTADTCAVSPLLNPFNPVALTEVFESTHQIVNPGYSTALPNWHDMKTIMAMPILGVDEWTRQQFCSYFQLDYTNATIEPIECSHRYLPGFDPAIPMIGTLTSVVDGAVTVNGVSWRIDFPALPC